MEDGNQATVSQATTPMHGKGICEAAVCLALSVTGMAAITRETVEAATQTSETDARRGISPAVDSHVYGL